jgi:hypothetical protein
MSNGEQVQAKKGLPVWAWIGIGCGALLIVVLIVVMAGGYFLAHKAKNAIAEFEENPALVGARWLVKANPDLEEVAVDEDAGTMTIRNKKTGEEITVNFEDIENGRLSFKTDKGEVKVDASELKDSGSMTVTNDEGEVVFSTGGQVSGDVESWVPIYPGCEPKNLHTMRSDEEQTGGFELETTASVSDVLEFYRSTLEGEGYEVTVNTFTQDNSDGGMVNANRADEGRSVVAIFNSENGGPTKIMVTYSDK